MKASTSSPIVKIRIKTLLPVTSVESRYQWGNDDAYAAHVKLSPDCLWLKNHHDELMAMRKHACRRCSAKFSNNTKLHQHIQDHHQKKPEKPASEITIPSPNELAKATPDEPAETPPNETAMSTTPVTPPPPSEPALMPTSPTSLPEVNSKLPLSLTPPATPMASKASTSNTKKANILGRHTLTPNRCTKALASPVPTPKRVLSILETAPVTCPPTSDQKSI
ncbi:hypothetical protein G7Y79_00019g046700 [Physcia stellaris]|nr:hypothetical protein G7Y79_00019g046700 [Physcia stellaris]